METKSKLQAGIHIRTRLKGTFSSQFVEKNFFSKYKVNCPVVDRFDYTRVLFGDMNEKNEKSNGSIKDLQHNSSVLTEKTMFLTKITEEPFLYLFFYPCRLKKISGNEAALQHMIKLF